MASLYEIDNNIRAILDSLYDSVDENGEVGEVDFEQIENLQEERRVKLENIALYVKNCDSESLAIQHEIDILRKRQERLERKSESLRGLLIRSMNEHNEPEISSARFTAKIRRSESTEIVDFDSIPKEFIREIPHETEYKPDKTAIKKAIKAGQEVAGARLVVNEKLKIE